MCLSAPKPVRSDCIACSHHSSDIATRIELMLSKVGFLSVLSQTGRNLIAPCQCWFAALMKAKLRLSQPVIKSRLLSLFFFSSPGRNAGRVTCIQKKPVNTEADRCVKHLSQSAHAAPFSRWNEWLSRCFQVAPLPPSDEVALKRQQCTKCKKTRGLFLLPDLTSLCLQLFIPWRPNPKPRPDGAVRAFASGPHQSYAGQ